MLAGTGREHLARNLPPMDFAVSATLRSGLLFSVVHSTLSAADSDQLWPFSYRITSLALLLPRLYPGGSAVLVSWGGRHGMGGGGFHVAPQALSMDAARIREEKTNHLIDRQAGRNGSSVLSTGDGALCSSPELLFLGRKPVTITLSSFISSLKHGKLVEHRTLQ